MPDEKDGSATRLHSLLNERAIVRLYVERRGIDPAVAIPRIDAPYLLARHRLIRCQPLCGVPQLRERLADDRARLVPFDVILPAEFRDVRGHGNAHEAVTSPLLDTAADERPRMRQAREVPDVSHVNQSSGTISSSARSRSSTYPRLRRRIAVGTLRGGSGRNTKSSAAITLALSKAVRNFGRAGVARSTAMQMSGHKTESIYRRYAIQDETTLREGSQKIDAWTEQQAAAATAKAKGQVRRFRAARGVSRRVLKNGES